MSGTVVCAQPSDVLLDIGNAARSPVRDAAKPAAAPRLHPLLDPRLRDPHSCVCLQALRAADLVARQVPRMPNVNPRMPDARNWWRKSTRVDVRGAERA
eukprot:2899665-Rhodomonas_salina.1